MQTLKSFSKNWLFSEVFRVFPIRTFKIILWLRSSKAFTSFWPWRVEAVPTVVRFSVVFKILSIFSTFSWTKKTALFTSIVKMKLVWNNTWRDNGAYLCSCSKKRVLSLFLFECFGFSFVFGYFLKESWERYVFFGILWQLSYFSKLRNLFKLFNELHLACRNRGTAVQNQSKLPAQVQEKFTFSGESNGICDFPTILHKPVNGLA